MNYLGIISLLIVVAVGAWWGGKNFSSSGGNEEKAGSYNKAIESAKDVSNQMAEKAQEMSEEVSTAGAQVTIYDGVSVSAGTKIVNLSGKDYPGSLKGEVRLLTELRELNLSNNKFTGLPAEVGQLAKLQVLNLSNNPLTGLPHELANLKSLKVLDLRGTNYSAVDLKVITQGLPASTEVLVD